MKVKCVDSYLMKGFLTKGKIYNVELNEERGYTIVDDGGKLYVYAPYRFVAVDNSPAVTNYKTVVAITSKFNGKKLVVSRTSEYIVVAENNSSYYIINDCGQIGNYSKSYFIEINK